MDADCGTTSLDMVMACLSRRFGSVPWISNDSPNISVEPRFRSWSLGLSRDA